MLMQTYTKGKGICIAFRRINALFRHLEKSFGRRKNTFHRRLDTGIVFKPLSANIIAIFFKQRTIKTKTEGTVPDRFTVHRAAAVFRNFAEDQLTNLSPIRKTIPMETKTLTITSPAFMHEGAIPSKYTCDGDNINPPLQIAGLPENTITLALIVEDPDAPKGIFDHWIVWNIDPIETIKEDSRPGISGTNSMGKTGYSGPCPPNGTHRYFFYVLALDTDIDLAAGADKTALQQAMEGHIIAQGSIMGTYKRSNL